MSFVVTIMLVAVAPGPAQGGQPPSGTFDDDDGNLHEPNIEAIAAEQITLGCGPRLYCPGANVTRAEMAAFLLRAIDHDGHLPDFQARFDDVPPGQWYTGYVEHLAEHAITQGCSVSPSLYCPTAPVSRAEMAAFILRAIGHADHLPSYQGYFADVPAGLWYTALVEHLYEHGITLGCGGGNYCPNQPVRRDEMASFIARALGLTPNNTPGCANDSASVDSGETLNDSVVCTDADAGDTLTYARVDDVDNGTLTFNSNGSFSYTPNGGFSGIDSFTFMANDGTANSATATFTINVAGPPGNAAPVCANDSASVDSGETLNDSVVCTDADAGDTLTYARVDDVDNGTLTFNSNGSFSYTPNGGFSGIDSFTFMANDGTANSATATFTITVDPPDNQAPVANDDNAGAIAADCMRILRVLTNDTDPQGDALTITEVSNPPKGDAFVLGSFIRYVSDGTLGEDQFTYTISDGTSTAMANVGINIFLGENGEAGNGDEIADECDPFAQIEDASSDLLLGVDEQFGDANGMDWNSTVFTGIMTNSVDASLTQVTTNAHNGLGQFVVTPSTGEAFNHVNTQDNAYQVNIATDPALVDFFVHGRICTPYPSTQFGAAGIFFGPGDQENYIKLQLTPNSTGVLQAQDVREVDGAGFGITRRNVMPGTPPPSAPPCVEIRIRVDVNTLVYSPAFSVDDGVTWTGLGGCTTCRTVPANWLDGTYPYGSDSAASRALAAGIISTSQGQASPDFSATYDFFKVYAAP